MATPKAPAPPKAIRLVYSGTGEGRQVYTNNGIEIESGSELTLSSANLPPGFPLTLAELASEAAKVEGMEVIPVD